MRQLLGKEATQAYSDGTQRKSSCHESNSDMQSEKVLIAKTQFCGIDF